MLSATAGVGIVPAEIEEDPDRVGPPAAHADTGAEVHVVAFQVQENADGEVVRAALRNARHRGVRVVALAVDQRADAEVYARALTVMREGERVVAPVVHEQAVSEPVGRPLAVDLGAVNVVPMPVVEDPHAARARRPGAEPEALRHAAEPVGV